MASSTTKRRTTKRSKRSTRRRVDQRVWRIAGLVLLLLAFYLLVAGTSYLFTHRADHSWVTGSGSIDADAVRNVLGPVGAWIAHHLIAGLFGVASLGIVVVLFVLGVNVLFARRVFKVVRTTGHTVVLVLLSSMVLAFVKALVVPQRAFPLGGAWGDFLTGPDGLLMDAVKPVGTAALLVVLALAYVLWVADPDLDALRTWLRRLRERPDEADDAADPAHVVSDDETLFEKDSIEDEVTTGASSGTDEADAATPDDTADDPGDDAEDGSLDFEVRETGGRDEDDSSDVPADDGPELEVEDVHEDDVVTSVHNDGNYDPTADLSHYEYPPLDLLEAHGDGSISIDKDELEANKDRIVETLRNYKIEISKIKATIGPTITLYEIVPAKGIRISKIKNLEDDIALSLAALGIRIIAPIPGKGTIGIEVPNARKEIVSSRSVLSSKAYRQSDMELPIALGKTISNEVFIVDLAKMPHILMAGATGQGKSVGINQILVSLLYKKHPSQLKFVLVDPKKVELSIYNMIEKHFLAKLPGEDEPIITETQEVVKTLNSLCVEMDERYDLLKDARARNIKEYNKKFTARTLNPEKGHRFMPYIVLVIDEFADLIMTAGKEVETPVARLAQLARAIGIHLILATQRPSVNIITGVIKANFPARISFRVTSKVDSRTILDAGGADQLIGKGDMLFSQGSEMIRLQCAFVDTPEVQSITEHIADQQGYPSAMELPEYIDPNESSDGGAYSADERDELFVEAAHLVVRNQMGSTSLLQRRLKLGYNRAGRIMDQLEDAGIVGPNVGSKAREVMYPTEADLEQYLPEILND